MQLVLRIAERALRNLIDQRRGRSPLALVDCGHDFIEANQAWEFWVHLAGEPVRNYWRASLCELQHEHSALHAGAHVDIPLIYNTLAIEAERRRHMIELQLMRPMQIVMRIEPNAVPQECVRAEEESAAIINRAVEGMTRQAFFGMDMAATTNAEPAPGHTLTVATLRTTMEQVLSMGGGAHNNVPPTSAYGDFNRPDIRAEWMRDALIFGTHFLPIGFTDLWRRTDAQAEARGMSLLKSWLSPRQLKQFEKRGYFDVNGSMTGRRYRIKKGSVQNVYRMGGRRFGAPEVGLCFAPQGDLVAGDVMLAQKIALETDEESALAVANEFDWERYYLS